MILQSHFSLSILQRFESQPRCRSVLSSPQVNCLSRPTRNYQKQFRLQLTNTVGQNQVVKCASSGIVTSKTVSNLVASTNTTALGITIMNLELTSVLHLPIMFGLSLSRHIRDPMCVGSGTDNNKTPGTLLAPTETAALAFINLGKEHRSFHLLDLFTRHVKCLQSLQSRHKTIRP